ncbi:autotransporter outer membrane beta-barrel domain-containing protein [Pseudomonas sp. PDM18]|uniref:autotransporter outer membrane beta-barrel domain-containing protein n=1 Tax=Pseudomonas sp. PDM18 TaxID=2769253 RepID=UPI00177CB1ED|nr:autotransporter outer membrane beta-barrel domain-containing protein [Pseudomonas sp. PDM18]MBD9677978.1 autotransporter outer membrane beta-barrel domain-containing protein [Pseudomonas sp. PDM18]
MEPLTRSSNLSHTPLALFIAMLIASPALAVDFNSPQVFTATNALPHALVQSRVDIPGNGPAVNVQGTDFSLRDALLRNAGSGGALQALGGAVLDATALDAQTLGGRSPAIRVDSSSLRLSDSSLVTRGILSYGIQVSGASALQVEHSRIETFETSSTGILVESDALPGLVSHSQIHTHKAESAGVGLSASGPLELVDTRILTEGSSSYGVSANNGSQVLLGQGSTVNTQGDYAAALSARDGSAIAMSDGSVFTQGRQSTAALAGRSSQIELQNTQLLSAGAQSSALEISGDSRIGLWDSQAANVDDSTVLFSGGPGIGQLELTDSALTGQQDLIETASGSQGHVDARGAQLHVVAGSAFLVRPGSVLSAAVQGATVEAPTLASVEDNGQFDLLSEGSSLHGNTQLLAPSRGRLDMDLGTSTWEFAGNASLGNLKLRDSTVFFSGPGYQVLTVNGDLTGNGRFQMKTDLSTSQGDLLQVLGQAQGSHELLVADSGRDAQGAPLKLVGTAGGAGQFSLLGGHVDAGAFRYGLQQQGNDWYLVQNGQVAPMTALAASLRPQQVPQPNGSSVPMIPLNPSMRPQFVPQPNGSSLPMTGLIPSMRPQLVPQPKVDTLPMTALTPAKQPAIVTGAPAITMSTLAPASRPAGQAQRLSKGANAALGMQSAAANLWQSELGTLTRRLGELRQGHDQGGLWTRATGAKLNVDTDDSRAYGQRMSGAEIGADRAIEHSQGTLYVGGMLGVGHSDQDFGEHSSGELASRSVGLYATYVREDGWYLDSVLKYDHLRGEVKVPTNVGVQVRGHYDSDAYGASVELGRTLQLGQGWFVEPQMQLAAAHLQGPQYTSSDDLQVDGDAVDSVQARAGGRAGRNWQLDSGAQVQGYLSASWIDELAGDSTVKVNGHSLDNQLPGSRAELGAGGSLLLSAHQKLIVEAHYANGHEIEQPLSLTLGYRYLW